MSNDEKPLTKKRTPAAAQQTTILSPQAPPSSDGAATPAKRVVAIADRVKTIIARRLNLPASQQLKPEDDFEMDLGATPTQVSLIVYDPAEEYKIKMSDSDAKKIKTAGEAIAYIGTHGGATLR